MTEAFIATADGQSTMTSSRPSGGQALRCTGSATSYELMVVVSA